MTFHYKSNGYMHVHKYASVTPYWIFRVYQNI